MTPGLMSLAYMAELAVVFNLAYAELKSGRYVRKTAREILMAVSTFDDLLAKRIRENLKHLDEEEDLLGSLGEKITELSANRPNEVLQIRTSDLSTIGALYNRLE